MAAERFILRASRSIRAEKNAMKQADAGEI